MNEGRVLYEFMNKEDDDINGLSFFFFVLQYYEMSYGLNVEMHKQVMVSYVCTVEYARRLCVYTLNVCLRVRRRRGERRREEEKKKKKKDLSCACF